MSNLKKFIVGAFIFGTAFMVKFMVTLPGSTRPPVHPPPYQAQPLVSTQSNSSQTRVKEVQQESSSSQTGVQQVQQESSSSQTGVQQVQQESNSSQTGVQQVQQESNSSQKDPQESWVEVAGTKTLLRSAYQEHRTRKNEVRVISVVLRSEKVAYSCSLRCQGKLFVSKGTLDIPNSHFGYNYGTGYIMCPIPAGCGSPSHIAVSSAGADDKPDQTFLEVKNQNATKDSFPYTFTVCYSVMYNYTNVLQLVQSLELLQLLGVKRVAIYKTNCSQETERVLDYYTQSGLVQVIPWSLSQYLKVSRGWKPDHDPGDIQYFGQIPALNDCVYRYMYQSRYVALHDLDELILPQTVNSWPELLPVLEKQYGADKCWEFQNNVFPALKPPPASTSEWPQSWYSVPGVNILDHLQHYPTTPNSQCGNYKIIVNPRIVFVATVHGLVDPANVCLCIDRNIARMYHIRTPYESQVPPKLDSDKRLLNYKDDLVRNVNTVLERVDLT